MKTSATRTLFAFSVLFVLVCLGTSVWLWASTAPVKAQSEPNRFAGQDIAEAQEKSPADQLAVKTAPSLSPDQAFTDLSVDDGFPEAALGVSGGGTITGVNRLTPPSYPSTLTSVALYFQSQMGLAPGAPITILIGTNPSGGANLSNISFTQINTVAETGGSYFFYTVSPVTINSGDFVVGWRTTHAAGILPLPVDRTQPRNQRSYISTGGALSPLDTTAPAFAGNLLIRARVQGQAPGCPSVSNINPPGGVVGSQVTITGNNFTGVSAIRFTGGVNAQFTVNSNTQLTATVPQGAATGPLTISKPNCSDVQTSAFAINTSSATELAVDDGSFETGLGLSGGGTSWRVNRLTPTSYPATLNGVSIFFRTSSNLLVGAPLTIVFGSNPGGTPNINSLQLQTMESTVQPLGQFNVYNVPPLTINSGDFVVGYKITHDASVFPYALDTTPPSQRRSYRSLDGVTYNILDDIPQTTAGNYGIRARLASGAAPTTISTISAASFLGNEQASEAIVAGFGANLSNTTEVASSLPLPTTLAGLTLKLRDSASREQFAQFFFVSPGQINYLLPPNMANGLANITLMRGTTVVATGTVQITRVAPGLFAANANGQGPAAAIVLRVRADGSQSFEPVIRFDQATGRFVTVPIDLGPETDRVFLLLFGTGFRQRTALSAVNALIGGTNAEVFFAGAQGDLAGLDQANLLLSRSLIGRGEVDVGLTVDGKLANVVRISIR
jgi:uncharacterized protein (TIGR03437 family)